MGIINFSPIQIGTGDPSPTNVRSIKPGLSIKYKNLLDPTVYNLANSNNKIVSNDDYRSMWCKIPSTGGTYTISRDVISGNRFQICTCVDKPVSGSGLAPITSDANALSITFTVAVGYNYLFVYLANDGSTITSNIQIEKGSVATEYEPYHEYIEAYGGYVDFDNSEITIDTQSVIMGLFFQTSGRVTSIRQNTSTGMTSFWLFWNRNSEGEDGAKDSEYPKCDVARTAVGLTEVTNSSVPAITNTINYPVSVNLCLPTSLVGTTQDSIWGYLSQNPIQIVTKLATPVKKTLDTQQLTDIYNQLAPVSQTMLAKRRRMIMNNQLLIPPGYQKCDCVQTTGYDARIDTGVAGNDTSLEIAGDIKVLGYERFTAPWGNNSTGSNKKLWRCIHPSGQDSTIFAFGTYKYYSTNITGLPKNTWMNPFRFQFLVRYGYVQCTINGITYSKETDLDDKYSENDTNIAIGSIGPAIENNHTVRHLIYSFKIWKQGKLIRSYIPCVRKSDNKAGLYDIVNHTFNPSIGAVDFIAVYDS